MPVPFSRPVKDAAVREDAGDGGVEEGAELGHGVFGVDVFEGAEFCALLGAIGFEEVEGGFGVPGEEDVFRAGGKAVGDELGGEVGGGDSTEGFGGLREEVGVLLAPVVDGHDGRDGEADGVAGRGDFAQGTEALRDGGGATFKIAGDGLGVDGEADAGAAIVGKGEKGIDVRELGGEAELGLVTGRERPSAEVLDGCREGAGEVLDAEGVGVAGGLEGGALAGTVGGTGGDGALAEERGERGEDFVEVGVGAGDGWAGERAGEVTVLAMGGAALGEVELPVGRRWDGLELAAGRRRGDDGEAGLRLGVGAAFVDGRFAIRARGFAGVANGEGGEAVGFEAKDFGPEGFGAGEHGRAVRVAEGVGGDENAAGAPEA